MYTRHLANYIFDITVRCGRYKMSRTSCSANILSTNNFVKCFTETSLDEPVVSSIVTTIKLSSIPNTVRSVTFSTRSGTKCIHQCVSLLWKRKSLPGPIFRCATGKTAQMKSDDGMSLALYPDISYRRNVSVSFVLNFFSRIRFTMSDWVKPNLSAYMQKSDSKNAFLLIPDKYRELVSGIKISLSKKRWYTLTTLDYALIGMTIWPLVK